TPDLRVLRWNEAASRLFDRFSAEAAGNDLLALLGVEGASEVARTWRESFALMRPAVATLGCAGAGGRRASCRFTCVPLGNGRPESVLALAWPAEGDGDSGELRQYDSAVEGMDDGFFDWDLGRNTVRYSRR